MPEYGSIAMLVARAQEEKKNIGQIVAQCEAAEKECGIEAIYQRMRQRLEVMRQSIERGVRQGNRTESGMTDDPGSVSYTHLQEQAHCPIGNGVFRKIVINDQHVLAGVHELLCDGTPRIGCDILHRRGIRRRCGDDDGIVHCAMILQDLNHLGDGGGFLANGDIDADDVLPLLI